MDEYKLSIIRTDGKARELTASGYGAETIMDKRMNEYTLDPRIEFALLLHNGEIRRRYARTL